jgi:hypothetical protein
MLLLMLLWLLMLMLLLMLLLRCCRHWEIVFSLLIFISLHLHFLVFIPDKPSWLTFSPDHLCVVCANHTIPYHVMSCSAIVHCGGNGSVSGGGHRLHRFQWGSRYARVSALPCSRTRGCAQQAIRSVASVLEPYDTDKMYPVYGFGAKLRDPSTGAFGVVQHCFPVYGAGLEVHGVDGILQVQGVPSPSAGGMS